jgi:glycosyltransferase involved in cell wall biosynthesis
MKFSVLCSLYIKEKPNYFNEAMESLYFQSVLPDQIVIVQDGPVSLELIEVLNNWREKLPITDVILKENVGLGKALNVGLSYCLHELVARVDTDDINLPDRFKTQLDAFKNNKSLVLHGTQISEFSVNKNESTSIRRVPESNLIKSNIFFKNPFNHMSVMFKKSCVQSVGGYEHLPYMEDYYLWMKLFKRGFEMDNSPDVHVLARVGNGMIERRHGVRYFYSEIIFAHKVLKLGVPNKLVFTFTFISRSIVRILPLAFLKLIYKIVRKS